MADYVKKHGEGNPTFKIDKWVENPEMVALPTIGEPLKAETLARMDVKDVALLADSIRKRKQEFERAIKERGWTMDWERNKLFIREEDLQKEGDE